ncbi:MAG TPA: hypothetical protein VKY82_04685 [Flavobacterium sp.]|nr:hypothetical protein [Flavobacterium sp.]
MKKLLNPIEFFDDKKLLITNLIIFVAGTIVAVLMRAWFSSIIQVLFKSKVNVYETIIENIVCVLLLTAVFFISGKIINKKTRFIDCLNLGLYIRIPFYIVTLFNCTGVLSQNMPIKKEDGSINIPTPSSPSDYFISLTTSALNILIIIFLILVIYRSFKTITNAKKTSDYVIFIIILLTGIILSPVILNLI